MAKKHAKRPNKRLAGPVKRSGKQSPAPPAQPEPLQEVDRGATGAGLPVRQAMRHMSKRVRLLQCTQEDLLQALNFARGVMTNPKASRRDRIRSSELIHAVSKQADDMAKALDRAEKDILYPTTPTGGSVGGGGDEDDDGGERGGAAVEVLISARVVK